MSVTKGTPPALQKGGGVGLEIPPGERGFKVIDKPFGEVVQGEPDQIFIRAFDKPCWFILQQSKVFGIGCVKLAAGESYTLTRDDPAFGQTKARFTNEAKWTEEQVMLDAAAFSLTDRPGSGPIHTIPPLVG